MLYSRTLAVNSLQQAYKS